jgi:transcriptional regulator with XRE-family HTH domain
VLARARVEAGLSQLELARRAGTSRPTLSAYEHGRKAPTADTLERLLAAAGFRLEAVPNVRWHEAAVRHGRSFWTPDRLWRLPAEATFADVVLPIELNWSAPGRLFRTRDRRERARLYEVVLREGEPAHIERWVDGALLVDGWDNMVMPRALRQAWQPIVDSALTASRTSIEAGATLGTAS